MRFIPQFIASVALVVMALAAPAQAYPGGTGAPYRHPGWDFSAARELPLQGGGRVKPLDSFAREVMLFETGSRSYEGWDPVDFVFSMIAQPEAWQDHRFIQVSREDVRRQLGLDEKRTRFSPRELMTNQVLGQYAMTAGSQSSQVSAPIPNTPKTDAREQEFKRVFERLGLFNRMISGEAWTIVPAAPGAKSLRPGEPAPWASLAVTTGADADKGGAAIRDPFIEMIRAYQKSDSARFDSAAAQARAAIETQIPGWTARSRSRIEVEAVYNQWRPFLWSWIGFLLAALIWIVARGVSAARPGSTAARGWTAGALTVTGVGAALLIGGIAMRCYVAGRPPVTNMYESVIWVALGQLFFAAILYAIHRQAIVMIVACVLGTAALIAADSAPAVMDPGLHPLVPVLRSNYWLTIHVLTITLGYAAFALTLGLGNVSLYHFLRGDRPGAKVKVAQKIAMMNQLTYRAMQFGVVLLAAGTILGGVWADYSWGRFWGWDPKEVWALIALLCYLAILHGRFTGWVGQFGFAAWSVISFLSVMMAWYGVNFVLGVGLHSYGFASGGGFLAVMSFVAAQLAWIGVVAYVHKRNERGLKSGRGAAPAPAAG